MTRFRITFMGSDPIALPALELLHREFADRVVLNGVFTQPDRRSGRGMKRHPNLIKQWAQDHGLPVRQPARLGSEDEAWLVEARSDLLLVMAYGHILRESLIAIPPAGSLNLHASLLPALRGASPIPGAIASGLDITGVTLMRIARRLDAGASGDRETVPIESRDRTPDVSAGIAQAAARLLQRAIPAIIDGSLRFAEQDDSAATYTRIITREDGALDFSMPAVAIERRFRALQPWPGGYFTIEDDQSEHIRVEDLDVIDREAREAVVPGMVVASGKDGLVVRCGSGCLRIGRLQRPGGRMLPAPDFLRGYPIAAGKILPSIAATPLVGSRPFPRPTRRGGG